MNDQQVISMMNKLEAEINEMMKQDISNENKLRLEGMLLAYEHLEKLMVWTMFGKEAFPKPGIKVE